MEASREIHLRVAIVGFGIGFPRGGGGTSRALAYARGLRKAGADVEIIVARPSEHPSNVRNTERRGERAGIPFRYTCSPIQADNGLAWHTANFRALLAAGPALREFARDGGLDAVLYYGTGEPMKLTVVSRFCRQLGASLLMDLGEAPFVDRDDFRGRMMKRFAGHGYRKLDGVVAISSWLEEYIRPRLRADARILRVPIMVDVDRHPEPSARPERGGTIAYLGDFGHPGEVTALIEAFGAIAQRHPDWRLLLMGDTHFADIKAGIHAALDRFGLRERAELPGNIPLDEVPDWLAKADIMALPRAHGRFSLAGFPTKLGEYLATGRPVVVTATGDIPAYLTDGQDAYLVPPDDPAAFSAALERVIVNESEAEAVGRRGRDTARRAFDYAAHGERLRDFITQIRGGR